MGATAKATEESFQEGEGIIPKKDTKERRKVKIHWYFIIEIGFILYLVLWINLLFREQEYLSAGIAIFLLSCITFIVGFYGDDQNLDFNGWVARSVHQALMFDGASSPTKSG